MKTCASLSSAPLVLALCVGCGSSEDGSRSPVVGVWSATAVEANGIEATETWHFYEDGHVDFIVERTNAEGHVVRACAASTQSSHWEDRGNKLFIRLRDEENEHFYELTEGGTRLRIQPKPVVDPQYWRSVDIDTYQRNSKASSDCASAGS
jgi:hypothetical protein